MGLKFHSILAMSENNGIGYKGGLPWSLRKEMNYFSRMTKEVQDTSKQNAVIMGRMTWESMPQNRRLLPGRLNIVLSSQSLDFNGAIHCRSLDEVVTMLNSEPYNNTIETAWIIGGSKVYESAVRQNLCNRIYLTNILKEFPCDTFVNLDLTGFKKINDPKVPTEVQEEDGIQYIFNVYEKTTGTEGEPEE